MSPERPDSASAVVSRIDHNPRLRCPFDRRVAEKLSEIPVWRMSYDQAQHITFQVIRKVYSDRDPVFVARQLLRLFNGCR
jgi:hypothetical protein